MSQGLRSSDPETGLFSLLYIHTLNSEPQLQYSKEIEQCILTQHLPYEAEVLASAERTSAKGCIFRNMAFSLCRTAMLDNWPHCGNTHLPGVKTICSWAELWAGVWMCHRSLPKEFQVKLTAPVTKQLKFQFYRPTGMTSFKCISASNLKPLVWWSKIKYFRKNPPISMTKRSRYKLSKNPPTEGQYVHIMTVYEKDEGLGLLAP